MHQLCPAIKILILASGKGGWIMDNGYHIVFTKLHHL